MTEQEKKAIETTKAILKEWQKIVDIEDPTEREIEMSCYIEEMPFYEMQTLLKIIKKQQKEKKLLANGIRVLGTNPDITTEEIIKEFTEKPISEEYMKKFKSSYISKDKVRNFAKELLKKNLIYNTTDFVNGIKELLKEK